MPASKTKMASSDRQLTSRRQALSKPTSRGTTHSKSAADIASQDRTSVAALSVSLQLIYENASLWPVKTDDTFNAQYCASTICAIIRCLSIHLSQADVLSNYNITPLKLCDDARTVVV